MAVTDLQRRVHVVSELAAMFVVVPYLAALSTRPQLAEGDKWVLRTLAGLTFVVDGWLLSRWLRPPQ
jgi:hypothetical protein